MSDTLLHIENLDVQYRSNDEVVHAVNGLSLDMRSGETLGLVGETGAGKTTTALSIMRLLPQRTAVVPAGSILFEGQELLALKEREMQKVRGKDISMIFQDPMTSLNPVLTVRQQIFEVLELHNTGATKNEMNRRVDEVLEMVGIPPKRGGEYPHQFSGGMKQRVVIAMALVAEPKLLIADEPTTALDVTIQAQVLAMMADLKEQLQMAMLLITHDLGVVAEVCDSVGIMYAGSVVESGTVEDVFDPDKPKHPYTRGLFEAIPNMRSTATRLVAIDGLMPDPTDLPPGCPFHPRCPACMAVCKTEAPPACRDGAHLIRCHLYSGTMQGGNP